MIIYKTTGYNDDTEPPKFCGIDNLVESMKKGNSDWKDYMSLPKKKEIGDFLKEHFGEECEDYEEECYRCQKYKALETLFENPYDD